jgi:hypothetical protein
MEAGPSLRFFRKLYYDGGSLMVQAKSFKIEIEEEVVKKN